MGTEQEANYHDPIGVMFGGKWQQENMADSRTEELPEEQGN
jgi:hypothetical protein